MKLLKLTIILSLLLLSLIPVYAVESDKPNQVVEGEVQSSETQPEADESAAVQPEESDSQDTGSETTSDLPEGLEIDPGGNVEESDSIYSLSINLPQELVGSEVSIQDSLGTNLKRETVSPTGQVSYNYMTPQSLNITVQGAIQGEEESDQGLMPITTAVVVGVFISMIVALLSFLGGRISALHVLRDLRDYIYDKNLD